MKGHAWVGVVLAGCGASGGAVKGGGAAPAAQADIAAVRGDLSVYTDGKGFEVEILTNCEPYRG